MKCQKAILRRQSILDKEDAADKLLEHLSSKRKATWKETVENIDMKHASWETWAAIKKLTGRKNILPNPHSVNLNAVVSCLMQNSILKQPNQEFTRNVKRQLRMAWKLPSADQDLCNDFSINEVMTVIKTLKAGKAPGKDNLHPEFFLHPD